MTTETTTRYFLKEMDGGSAKYGPCEICGTHASVICLQRKQSFLPAMPEYGTSDGWREHRSVWGHEHCLIKSRD